MVLEYRVILYTDKAVNAYEELTKKANWKERKILSLFEKQIFTEELEVSRGTKPLIIKVGILNNYYAIETAKKIKWPLPVITAYEQLGCSRGETKDFEVLKI